MTAGRITIIYPRMQSENTRNNTNDPLYELLTCMPWATCMAVRDMDFLYVLLYEKEFLMAVV